jgi:hypothetical protein
LQGWKAAGAAERSAYFAKMTARGEVVQQVATAYLRAIADESEVENASALWRRRRCSWITRTLRTRPGRGESG